MTRVEIIAEEIRDLIERGARDTKLQPAALRVEVKPILRTIDGYVIPLEIKTNRRQIETYHVTIARFA